MSSLVDFLSRVRVVLLHTTHPGNIGATARAMKTMGLTNLYLVEPKIFPSELAVARSSHAEDILDGAVVVETLSEAIADCHFVVGTGDRTRTVPWPLYRPREMAERAAALPTGQNIAIVFGREDIGMTNDQMMQCNAQVQIPANPNYSSLNLGSAVQVMAYEIRMAGLEQGDQVPGLRDWDEPPADQQDIERLIQHWQSTFLDTEFLDPKNPKAAMNRINRLLTRTQLDKTEVNILRGMLSSAQRWVARARSKD